jgi:hypothetical protein
MMTQRMSFSDFRPNEPPISAIWGLRCLSSLLRALSGMTLSEI